MAKRLLLFVVFCFVSVSFARGQCNKEFILDVNKRFNISSSNSQRTEKYLVCEGNSVELKLKDINPNGLTFLWYKNDSLLNESGSSLSIDKNGLYALEIKDNICTYNFIKFDLNFVRYLAQVNITTPQEIICENTGSAYPLTAAAINGYLNPFNYQWQKDGKDLSNQRDYFHLPTTAGNYAVRASSGLCSTTSPPITIHKSPDNIIQGDAFNIYIDKTYNANFKSDTIVFCKDNSYILQSARTTNWYLNDSLIATDSKYIPKQSGTYYTSETFRGNCYLKSKPVYILFDTNIPPIDYVHAPGRYLRCDLIDIGTGLDPNIRGNNQLRIYNATNNNLAYKFSNFEASLFQILKLGKYRIEYETGTCKSPPVDFEVKKITPSLIPIGAWIKVVDKKLTLCPNSMLFLSSQSNTDAEVQLYRDGILINTRQANHPSPSPFLITERGKYHMRIISRFCTPIEDVSTDTLEVEIPELISTILSQDKKSCNLENLRAANYTDYTYSWYKNGIPLPNEITATLSLKTKESGTYYAVLQKGLCSVSTQSVTYAKGFEDKITGQTQICEGEKLVLESTIQEATHLWKGPNNISLNQSALTIDKTTLKNSGWYFLTTTKNNCSATDSIYVTVSAKPNLSFEYINPVCPDKNLIMKVTGKTGIYTLVYDLPGPLAGRKTIYMNYDDDNSYINLGKMPSALPEEYDGHMSIVSNNCNFSIPLPKPGNTEDCSDVLAFTNLKEKYCHETHTTLTINVPKSMPVNTKFKLSLKNETSYFNLGTTTSNTVEVQMPSFSLHNAYFIIESEDGKYSAISKAVDVIGSERPLIIAFNGTDSPSTTEGIHCDGYATKIAIRYPRGQSFQWKKDGIDIVGANHWEFAATESGKYTISVTELGCATESTNSLDIKSGSIPDAAIKSITGFQSICKGFGVPMIETNGFGYDKYVWKHNGYIVAEKTTNEIFEARETGYYLLEASQGTCKKVTDSIYINVSDLAKTLIKVYSANPDKDKVYVCDSSSINFYNGSFNIYNRNSEDITQFLKKYGLSFQWKHNGKDIPSAINPYTMTSNKPGKYVLQVKQGECIVNSNEIEIVQQEKVAVKLLASSYGSYDEKKNSISVCIGDSLTLYPDSKVLINDWDKELYKDGKLIESKTKANGNNFFNYFPIYESGAYYMKLSSSLQKNCSSLSDTIHVEVANKIVTLPIDTFAVCKDIIYTTSFIQADSFKFIYNDKVISNNPFPLVLDQPGSYVLEGKRNNGCIIKKPYVKENKIKPYVTSNRFYALPFPDPVMSCKGQQVNLAIAGINGTYTFDWYNGVQKLPFTDYSVNVGESGNYFAKVKYMDCEATTNAIKVDMRELKNALIPAIDSLALCLNGGFQNLETAKEPGYTYEWFKDNITIENNTSTLKATQPGTYKALIQSGDCSTLTSKIKIYPSTQLPTATISGDTTLNIGDTANLKLSFTSSPPFTYVLSNNLEGTSDKNTITHPVKVKEASIFKLASVKNACGEGTVSGEAKIQVIILANEPLIGHKVTVAPVPAESYCEIIFDLPTSQEVSYQLLDMKGLQLSEKNLGKVMFKKQYLNLNNLTAGEYLIKVQIGKEFVTRKLIKY